MEQNGTEFNPSVNTGFFEGFRETGFMEQNGTEWNRIGGFVPAVEQNGTEFPLLYDI